MLCRLAGHNQVQITGNDRAGSFSGRGVEGNYEFDEARLHGTFAGHGIIGGFSFEIGRAAVTVNEKPFWLPESLLKEKIAKGWANLAEDCA